MRPCRSLKYEIIPLTFICFFNFFFSRSSSNLECLFKSARRSAAVQKFDHNKFADKPGQAWDAKKQCELLLLDSDAKAMGTAETNSLDSSQQLEVSIYLPNSGQYRRTHLKLDF